MVLARVMCFWDRSQEVPCLSHKQGGLEVLPPPYHAVVGRQPSPPTGDFKSEKSALVDSQDAAIQASTGKPRRGLCLRVLRRLSCFQPPLQRLRATRPQVLPALRPSAASKGEQKQVGWWKRPEKTVQKGIAPRFWRSKYLIASHYCPIQRLGEADVDAAPWVAQWHLRCDDLSESFLKAVPWLNKLELCWSDNISIRANPLDNKKELLYSRRICLAYTPPAGYGRGWTATATIYHHDTQWLADLTYPRVGDLFRHDFLVRAAAFEYPTCDPLERSERFYTLYAKPLAEDEGYLAHIRKQESVNADKPEARRLVHGYFESCIPDLRNYADQLEEQ
ncbi:hypothetical protein N657DRAFT_647899 [Parathielavia appendiculata]|uniref:Uncharacterized protein n=1 Tax=Parathielavia appendiculata TaxID=2587402 RepID=A0AAN6TX52_9PEZI|nr:hypothetical protein N657DRAFT_647899 [Parathielavia appendiculata]